MENNNLLIDELRQEVERERWENLWKQYRLPIIAALCAVVLATGAYSLYNHMTRARNMEMTNALYHAFAPESRAAPLDAAKNLHDFAEQHADKPAGFMARVQGAALRLQAEDTEGALSELDTALAMNGVDDNLRAVAALFYVQIGLETEDAEHMRALLKPYLTDTSPYRHEARELAALLAYHRADSVAAHGYVAALLDDPATPDTIRRRASYLKRVLK